MPDKAYFGMKDYQQLRIIQTLTEKLDLLVEIVPCDTLREKDGLAMSSRNVRLTREERRIAPSIYRVLSELKTKISSHSVKDAGDWAISQLNKFREFRVEYLEIVDAKTLMPLTDWNDSDGVIACTAVSSGKSSVD